MITQSGISSLTLYDAATVSFTRVSATSVTGITSGNTLTIPIDQKPTFEAPVEKINRTNHYKYDFSFLLFGLVSDAGQYKNKFGWLVVITFLDGTQRFLESPSFLQGTELDVNRTHTYNIHLKPNRPTVKTLEVV
jgi:hypothetical protein